MLQFSIKGTGLNGVLSPGTTALDLLWQQKITQQEKGRKFEDRYATVYYKFMADDVEYLSETKNEDVYKRQPYLRKAHKESVWIYSRYERYHPY